MVFLIDVAAVLHSYFRRVLNSRILIAFRSLHRKLVYMVVSALPVLQQRNCI